MVWDFYLLQLPDGQFALPNAWVYWLKENPDINCLIFKSWLCFQGFLQQEFYY